VDAGRDEYGDWAEFDYEGVRQRLRWIPPGRFLMGSPEDEVGRSESEGPQHEVTIGAGFWLFATPVTQALYELITGENPSRDKGAARPVEKVSWHEAEAFMQRLNKHVDHLYLEMPSEAQWEYACRAGTTTATYAGDLSNPNTDGASLLKRIAWFRGNSNLQTQAVGMKVPNRWGLYDMLGNVLEWCADNWHGSYDEAPKDGSPWIDADGADGVGRVVRGGSWEGQTRHCRAAYRISYRPVERDGILGFRPAQFKP
jgi:formylglycine-generating enzyme required for sulfatase activity